MRTIITVVEFPSMPGRYNVKSDKFSGKYNHPRDVSGAPAAAAAAMEYAQRVGSRGYQIFAPAAVLAFIPEDMRGRA